MLRSTKIKTFVLIKASMLFILTIVIIISCPMSLNFSTGNRILSTRSNEESIKSYILNRFNNKTSVYNRQRKHPPIITQQQVSSSPSTIFDLTFDKDREYNDDNDGETSQPQQSSHPYPPSLSTPPEKQIIKNKILFLLSNKIRKRKQEDQKPFLLLNSQPHSFSSGRGFVFNHEQSSSPTFPESGSHPPFSDSSSFENPSSNESFDWSSKYPNSEEEEEELDDDVFNSNSSKSISFQSSPSSFVDLDNAFTTVSPAGVSEIPSSGPPESISSKPIQPYLNLSSSSQKINRLFLDLVQNSNIHHSNNNNSELPSQNQHQYKPTENHFSFQKQQKNNRQLRNEFALIQNDSCNPDGIVVHISTNYEISSPGYPEKYPPNIHCIWHIQSQKNQLLKVQIFKLFIEHDSGCRFDHLDIKGVHQVDKKTGKTYIRTKRFCGFYLKGTEFEIGSNHTTIEFHSDSYNEYAGFHLRIIAQSQDCTNEIFVHNSSYITSPNYPDSYEDSSNCWTLVHTREDHRLLVNFEDLHLESGVHCEFDYVEIFDSSKALPQNSLGKFCTYPPSSKLFIHSSAYSLLFHFESDNFLTLRGYKAKIVALRNDVNISSYMDCDWNADWQNMTISSPSYPEPYPAGSRCETSITAPSANERIVLLFDWIDLVDQDDVFDLNEEEFSSVNQRPQDLERVTHRFNCTLDRLEVYETLNDSKPSYVFCGFRSQPFRYESQTDSIRLVFHSVHQSQEQLPNTPRSSSSQSRSTTFYGTILNPGFRAKFTFTSADDSKNNNETDKNFITNKNRFSMSSTVSTSNGLTLVHRPENASIRLGSSHILYCEVKSQNPYSDIDSEPYRPIIWFKGDREIHDGVSNNGTSLMIRQFGLQSAGRYICVFGDNSSDAWLTLKPDTPRCSHSNVLFRERPRDQFTSEGEFVMLHCSATLANSQQDLDITWERLPLVHDHNLNESDQQQIKPRPVIYNSRIKKLSRGDLLFDRVLVEDSGYYLCVVRLDQPAAQTSNESFVINDDDDDCVVKSVARVQINRRVDVRDFCGRTSITRNTETMEDVGKIIGGTEAQPGEFPWMVMFWDEKRHVFCGGALLNERWVVTAAHCFTDILDESTVFVKLGKYDQTEIEPTEVVTKIQHIIKHPHFSNETFDNDIALVKLATHIQFTDNIRPICLATSSDEVWEMNSYFFSRDHQHHHKYDRNSNGEAEDDGDETTKFAFVTGWGRLKENGPLPRYLHKIRLPIVDRKKCRQSTTFKVTENMFCAGYGKEIVGDACKGDSGGPLVVQFHSRWTLLGIVSWGEGCGRPEKYGYYTKVNNYDNWIRRLTAVD